MHHLVSSVDSCFRASLPSSLSSCKHYSRKNTSSLNFNRYKFWASTEKKDRDRSIRSPESQVVSEQLHDQCTVLVGVFTQCIQLRDGLIKSLKWSTVHELKSPSQDYSHTNIFEHFINVIKSPHFFKEEWQLLICNRLLKPDGHHPMCGLKTNERHISSPLKLRNK